MEKKTQGIHVAIVGKPNVGKSTLFNRLIGKRTSVTDVHGGTTRDRVYARVTIHDKKFFLIDTGGMQYLRDESLDALVDREVNKAIVEADILIIVCDKSGVTALDYQLADDLRRRGKKIILTINKVDSEDEDVDTNDFYRLGFGEPICLSALHGTNIQALTDTIYSFLPAECTLPIEPCEFYLGIVGEPNSGKSTLLNTLLQSERAVVSEVAGTTRDSIEADFEFAERRIKLVDTGGIRKKKKIKSTAALFSLYKTQKTIKHADIIFLLIDATQGPRNDTRAIYRHIREVRKGCIILVNKWDLIAGIPMETYRMRLIQECGFLHNTPIEFISALRKRNIDNALQLASRVWQNYTVSVPTKDLNRFLTDIKRSKPPAPTVKFKYMVQVDMRPPTFVLFVKNKSRIPTHYFHFLSNTFIDCFSLEGVVPHIIIKEEQK